MTHDAAFDLKYKAMLQEKGVSVPEHSVKRTWTKEDLLPKTFANYPKVKVRVPIRLNPHEQTNNQGNEKGGKGGKHRQGKNSQAAGGQANMVRMAESKFKTKAGRHAMNGTIKGKDHHAGEVSNRFDQSHDSSQVDSVDGSSQDGGQMSVVSAEEMKTTKEYGQGRGRKRGVNKAHNQNAPPGS